MWHISGFHVTCAWLLAVSTFLSQPESSQPAWGIPLPSRSCQATLVASSQYLSTTSGLTEEGGSAEGLVRCEPLLVSSHLALHPAAPLTLASPGLAVKKFCIIVLDQSLWDKQHWSTSGVRKFCSNTKEWYVSVTYIRRWRVLYMASKYTSF